MLYEIGNLNKIWKYLMGLKNFISSQNELIIFLKKKFNIYCQHISKNIINNSISNKIYNITLLLHE